MPRNKLAEILSKGKVKKLEIKKRAKYISYGKEIEFFAVIKTGNGSDLYIIRDDGFYHILKRNFNS